MVTILPALKQIRKDLVKLLDRAAVERICRELGHEWRARQLDPFTTLHLFILQVVNRNTAMTHLPHLAGARFGKSESQRKSEKVRKVRTVTTFRTKTPAKVVTVLTFAERKRRRK